MIVAALLVACGSGSSMTGDGGDAPPSTDFRGFENLRSTLLPFLQDSEGGDGIHGAAWFDYDDDGLLDLFMTNGLGANDALFRNAGGGSFVDVAPEVGLATGIGSTSVVAGDLDNDGDQDLVLAGDGSVFFGPRAWSQVRLYRNDGPDGFTDVTTAAGIECEHRAASAVLGDLDRDGDLDLFIGTAPTFAGEEPDQLYPNQLFLNEGGLVFTEISESAGVTSADGVWAATFADIDDDGWVDLLVANEVGPIEMFHNNHDRTFSLTEVAGAQEQRAWMSFAMSDYDLDGDMDFFVTNFTRHGMFQQQPDGTFTDVAPELGIAQLPGRWGFGWGSAFADFDNDGDEDLVVTGALPSSGVIGDGTLASETELFINRGGQFTEESEQHGLPNLKEYYTSGLATGDFDNDGAEDFVIALASLPGAPGRPTLLRNLGSSNHWLTIRTQGTTSNRDGVGARIWVTAGGVTQVKDRIAGSSYMSMESPWVTFGLGGNTVVEDVVVRWPTGMLERYEGISIGQATTIVEGAGLPP